MRTRTELGQTFASRKIIFGMGHFKFAFLIAFVDLMLPHKRFYCVAA